MLCHTSLQCTLALSTSRRSFGPVLANTVKSTITLPGAIQYVIRVGRPERKKRSSRSFRSSCFVCGSSSNGPRSPEPIDMKSDSGLIVLVECEKPVGDLRLQLDLLECGEPVGPHGSPTRRELHAHRPDAVNATALRPAKRCRQISARLAFG